MAMWSSGLFDSLHKLESSNEDGPKSKLFNVMLMVFKSVPTTINGIDGQYLSCYDYQTGSAVRVAVYFREPVPTGSMGIAVYENSFTSFGRDNMFVQYAQEWVKLIESPATSLLTYKNISKPVLKSLEELMEEANISKKMEYAAVKLRLATGIDTTTDIGIMGASPSSQTASYARVWYIRAAAAPQTSTSARTIMRIGTGA